MLAHDQLEFLESKATIKGDCPFSNCPVNFSSTVWSPRVGMKLGMYCVNYDPDILN